MDSTTDSYPLRMAFLLLGLAAAALGWTVWLNLLYITTDMEKAFWLILAVSLFLVGRPFALLRPVFTPPSALLVAVIGLTGSITLGWPYGLPFAMGVVGCLLSTAPQIAVRRAGFGIFGFSLLLGIQAVLVPVAIGLAAKTGTIPLFSDLASMALGWVGYHTGVLDGKLVLRNAHFVWFFAPMVTTLGYLSLIPFAGSAALPILIGQGRKRLGFFLAVVLLAYPFWRFVLLSTAYLHWELMDLWLSPAVSLVLLGIPVLFVVGKRTLRREGWVVDFGPLGGNKRFSAPVVLALSLTFLGAFFLLEGFLLPNPGVSKEGRVLIDEAHGPWEWSDEAFTTDWYGGAATYNYRSIIEYLDAHFLVEHNYETLREESLSNTDVLIIKTPTMHYSDEEIAAIVKWVKNGGGVYLIGDHTNVFGMSDCLNPLARQFGFEFGYDATYEMESGSLQTCEIPALGRHPAMAAMPGRMLWGTSCSLTGSLWSDSVFIGNHLRTRYLDYGRTSNFADAFLFPGEKYGPVLQMGGAKIGKGRALLFTDSTILSNFWAFFPGKSEMFLGGVSWLNRKNSNGGVALAFVLSGSLFLFTAWRTFRKQSVLGPSILLTLPLAVCLAIPVQSAIVSHWYPLPAPRRHLAKINFDRTYSPIALPEFAMKGEMENSYQTLFTWMQRIGVTPRCLYSFEEATSETETPLLIIRPNVPPGEKDGKRLDEFLRRGGRILILDGVGAWPSCANLWTQPYGVSIDFRLHPGGVVMSSIGRHPPAVRLEAVPAVEGGEAILRAGGIPVLSRQQVGRGEIWVCTLAEPWSDQGLGTSNAQPTAPQKSASDLCYWVFDSFAGEREDVPSPR